MKSNKVLFEVQRDIGISSSFFCSLFKFKICITEEDDDDDLDIIDPTAGRFVQYRFPPAFLKLKQVGAL